MIGDAKARLALVDFTVGDHEYALLLHGLYYFDARSISSLSSDLADGGEVMVSFVRRPTILKHALLAVGSTQLCV
ncbi:hypothetical protein [Bradyrhizobium sp. CSA112]|uniref:hypothetical protein n=1 Tax=Bradyrhizobium sp. CSA112 TaxID=2699170 RepID=UPI0023AE8A9E|nr:hypothetical protein [Bradyrhizobium sp. CSA112]